MDILIPALKDYMDLPGLQEAISQETHPISETSPYAIDLDQLPKIRTGASTVLENVWLSVADAETLVTVEIETSTDTWEEADVVDSAYPGTLEVYFQIADTESYPYSPRLIFNSAYAGLQVRVSYTGMGSVPLARYFNQLYTMFTLLLKSSSISVIDMATYNNGRFDGYGLATTEVWAAPSDIMVLGTDGSASPFPGLLIDFGSGGDGEVAAFTNASYWKRILVSLDYDGSTWSVVTSESAEAQFQVDLVTPNIDHTYTILAYIDVQNDGTTGTAGAIEDLEEDNITRMFSQGINNPTPHIVRYYGNLETGDVDVPFAPFQAGQLVSFGIFLGDSGSSGQTRVNVLLCSSSDRTGTTVFTSSSEQAIITASSQEELAVCPLANFSTIDFDADNWFRFVIEEVATDANNLQCCLYHRMLRF